MTDEFPRFDPMTGAPLPIATDKLANLAIYASELPEPTPIVQPARITRAEIREIRRREREEGVDFPLAQTSREARREIVAKVRDLPFTDRTMLTGIPVELRSSLGAAMRMGDGIDANDIEASLGALEALDDLSRALCIAGFIWPKLVLHEHQLDGTDDCWLVDDLAASERDAYRDFAMRDRGGAKQEVERLATFPGAAVAEAPTG